MDDRLDITVRDEGTWREPRHETDRGRGLAIIRAIADDVSIDRDGEATVLRMTHLAQETVSA